MTDGVTAEDHRRVVAMTTSNGATYRALQLREFGRLTCTACGCDLGNADDPYRDPNCTCCHKRSDYAEYLAEEAGAPTERA